MSNTYITFNFLNWTFTKLQQDATTVVHAHHEETLGLFYTFAQG